MKKLILAVLVVSSVAVAAPPPAPAAPGTKPASWDERGGPDRAERKAEMEKKIHMFLVVGMADAMGLDEAGALKLGDKLKPFEDKRRPVREAMGEAMKAIKAAADGDATAGAQVEANIQKVLDGRQQMAALDKEMFTALSVGLTPQRKAQLAVFLARFHAEAMGKMGGMGGKFGEGGHGRRHE